MRCPMWDASSGFLKADNKTQTRAGQRRVRLGSWDPGGPPAMALSVALWARAEFVVLVTTNESLRTITLIVFSQFSFFD